MSDRALGPGAPAETDWTDQVADLVVDTVDRLHDRTTGPLLKAARGVVYGLVAVMVGAVVLVLLTLLTVRLLDSLPGPIWIPYLALGAVLVITGAILWSKRGESGT